MELWRRVFREAFAPLASLEGLVSLQGALECDDSRLLQGATTTPPPLNCVADWPVEACCLTAWIAWQGGQGEKQCVADVEEAFARMCYDIDVRMNEPAGCRHLLCFWDGTPRDEARAALIPEVRRAIQIKQQEAKSCGSPAS